MGGLKKFFKRAVGYGSAPFTGGASLALLDQGDRDKVSKIVPEEVADAAPTLYGAAGSLLGGPVGGALGGATGRIFKESMESADPNASLSRRIFSNLPKDALLGGGMGFGLQMLGAQNAAGGAGFGFTSSPNAGALQGVSQAAPTAHATGAAAPSSQGGSGLLSKLKQPLSSVKSLLGNGTQTGAATGQATSQATGQVAGQTAAGGIDMTKLLLAGGALGIGQLGGQSPEVPDFSQIPSVAALRDNAGQPNSELGKLATTQLSGRLTGEYSGLPSDVQSGVGDTFRRRRDEVTSQFKMYRPNADLATDSAYRQAITEIDKQESQTLAQMQMQDRNTFNTQRGQDIAQALGVDAQTLQQLTDLAQLDVQQIAMQLGISAQEAQQFRQTFGTIAAELASSAVGANRPNFRV